MTGMGGRRKNAKQWAQSRLTADRDFVRATGCGRTILSRLTQGQVTGRKKEKSGLARGPYPDKKKVDSARIGRSFGTSRQHRAMLDKEGERLLHRLR